MRKMESDGPYYLKRIPLGGVGIIGPNRFGEEISYSCMSEEKAKQCINFLNEGYAEGRKAAEKFYFADELPNNIKIFIQSSGRVVRILIGEGYFEQDNQEAAQRILFSEIRKAITTNREAAEKEARGIE